MNRYDSFKMNMKTLEFLRANKGKENIKSRKDIKKFLDAEGYSLSEGSVPILVERVRVRFNAPICFINSKGYFYAASREEIQDTVDDLERRRAALKEHVEFLKSFMLY